MSKRNQGKRVLKKIRKLFKGDNQLHLVGVELGFVAAMTATLAIAAAPQPKSARLAELMGGDLTARALAKLTDSMDPAMLALADRFAGDGADATQPVLVPASANAQAADGQEEVIRLQDLSPDAARIWNANNPSSTERVAAATPFRLNASGVLDQARAVDCLTAAVYYEAAMESTEGQRAVAQVVLNRMRHPAFPKTVCGVVFQGSTRVTGCQFSFTCDGSLNRRPSEAGWARARAVAEAALNGYVMKQVGNATHYHANYVAPYWSPSLLKIGSIGAHIFYRWTGSWGQPPAFSGAYGGNESGAVQTATLDGIAKSPAELQLASNADSAVAHGEPALEVAEPAPTAPQKLEEIAAVAAAASTATTTAAETTTFYKAQELDWAGRPKKNGPPRLAMH